MDNNWKVRGIIASLITILVVNIAIWQVLSFRNNLGDVFYEYLAVPDSEVKLLRLRILSYSPELVVAKIKYRVSWKDHDVLGTGYCDHE